MANETVVKPVQKRRTAYVVCMWWNEMDYDTPPLIFVYDNPQDAQSRANQLMDEHPDVFVAIFATNIR